MNRSNWYTGSYRNRLLSTYLARVAVSRALRVTFRFLRLVPRTCPPTRALGLRPSLALAQPPPLWLRDAGTSGLARRRNLRVRGNMKTRPKWPLGLRPSPKVGVLHGVIGHTPGARVAQDPEPCKHLEASVRRPCPEEGGRGAGGRGRATPEGGGSPSAGGGRGRDRGDGRRGPPRTRARRVWAGRGRGGPRGWGSRRSPLFPGPPASVLTR